MSDPVNHPRHYNAHPSGIECIQIVEHMSFNLGNAFKYLWRAGLKDNQTQDIQNALWYVARERGRRDRMFDRRVRPGQVHGYVTQVENWTVDPLVTAALAALWHADCFPGSFYLLDEAHAAVSALLSAASAEAA